MLADCSYQKVPVPVGAWKTPNDPKLSEPRGWRDRCVVERSEGIRAREKWWLGRNGSELEIAATVTRGAVRCSAWLGDV